MNNSDNKFVLVKNNIMPGTEWYIDWFGSPYYDLLYQYRNSQDAWEFIQRLLAKLNAGNGTKILDAGCANGVNTRAMSLLGLDVTGIDISFRLIDEAKKMESNNLHFYQHDMRLPFHINYFDIAFNLFNSFGYFRTEREHDNVIRTIAQSLKHNGTLVIDYLNTHYAEDNLVKNELKTVNDVVFHIARWHSATHFYKQIQVEEKGQVLKHLYTERVAKFSPGDFTDMLSYQGMQVSDMFGDYNLEPYDIRNSKRMVIFAKKLR
jgi:SAM-dependent methyltransferase